VRITHVLETHVHNDYVTGGLDLVRQAGAIYGLAAAEKLAFDFLGLQDGDEITVGGSGCGSSTRPATPRPTCPSC
jgi:hydroxyacylglutathione hydrolase